MVHGLNDRSCPARTLIFPWILRHEPLAGLGFMASLYYIGGSRKGHRKIKVRTGHDKELHGFIGFSDSIIITSKLMEVYMDKYLKQHEEKIALALLAGVKGFDWQKLKEYHLTRIMFMQHERMIHLMVTLAFAIMLFMTLGIMFAYPRVEILLMLILLGALLVPYIFYYYSLENGVQRWYKLADEIDLKLRKKKS